MAEFIANIPGPGSVTGGYPVHESTAAIIGSALGGLAKVLDVGLKAEERYHEEKLGAQLEDQIQEQAKAYASGRQLPPVIGEPPQDASKAALESSPSFQQGLNEMERQRQANVQRPNQRMFFANVSTIVQRMIHDNPAYANEIRERAQRILGTNPTEALYKVQQSDEDFQRQANRELDLRMAQTAQASGVVIFNNPGDPSSGYNITAMAQVGTEVAGAKYKVEQLRMNLENEKLAGDIRNADQEYGIRAAGSPETAEQRKIRIQTGLQQALDGPIDAMTLSYFNALGASRLLTLDITSTSSADQQIAREQVIQGIGVAEANVKLAIYNLARQLKNPDGSSAFDSSVIDEVEKFYLKPYEAMKELANGDLGAFKSMQRTISILTDQAKLSFATAVPMGFALRAAMGDQAAAVAASAFLDTNGPAATDLQTQMGAWMEGLNNVFTGKSGLPDPKSPGAKQIATASLAVMNDYSKRADKLTPAEVAAYQNGLSAYVATGMTYDAGNIRQVQAFTDATSNAGALAFIESLVKNPQTRPEGEHLAGSVLELNQHLIESMVPHLVPTTYRNRQFVSSTGEGKVSDKHDVTYEPVYNPDTGKMELFVHDEAGKPVKAIPGDMPIEIVNAITSINRALGVIERFKDYGGDTAKALNAAQAKQLEIQSAGIKLKPGSNPVPMPEPKAPEKKEEAPAPAMTTNDGWKIEVQ